MAMLLLNFYWHMALSNMISMGVEQKLPDTIRELTLITTESTAAIPNVVRLYVTHTPQNSRQIEHTSITN